MPLGKVHTLTSLASFGGSPERTSRTLTTSVARTDFDDDGMDIAEGQLDPDDVFRSYLGQ
jgi:hypothetical protein